MRKATAVILLLALLLSVSGCHTVTAPTDPEDTGTSQMPTGSTTEETTPKAYYKPSAIAQFTPASDEETKITVQYLPETVENPDNVPVLKWLCLVDHSTQVWSEAAVHELNQMLSDRNIPFRVQFVMLTTEVSRLHVDWFSRQQVLEHLKEADLVWGYLKPDDLSEYLSPITEYVTGAAQPSLKNAVIHKRNWIGTTVDEEIYGIRTYPVPAHSNGWIVDTDLMTACGLSNEDFKKNFWEMDEVFAKIYGANGNRPFLFCLTSVGRRAQGDEWQTTIPVRLESIIDCTYQYAGACFGVDITAETPTVVNMMGTETTRSIREALRRYEAAGYTTRDYRSAQIEATSIFSSVPYTNTDGLTYIPVSPVTYPYTYAASEACGITKTSLRKEEAVTLLNLIAEDTAFRNQLLFGSEGRDYSVTDQGYSVIKQADGSYYRMDFLSMHSIFSDILEDEYDFYPAYDGKSRLQVYRETMDCAAACEYPIVFDYTGFEEYLPELGDILGRLCWQFTSMPDDEYESLLLAFQNSGGNRIQAELQRQLNECLIRDPNRNAAGS